MHHNHLFLRVAITISTSSVALIRSKFSAWSRSLSGTVCWSRFSATTNGRMKSNLHIPLDLSRALLSPSFGRFLRLSATTLEQMPKVFNALADHRVSHRSRSFCRLPISAFTSAGDALKFSLNSRSFLELYANEETIRSKYIPETTTLGEARTEIGHPLGAAGILTTLAVLYNMVILTVLRRRPPHVAYPIYYWHSSTHVAYRIYYRYIIIVTSLS